MVVKIFFGVWMTGGGVGVGFYWGMARKKIITEGVDTGDEMWDNTRV